MNKSVGWLALRRRQKLGGAAHTLLQVREDLIDCAMRQPDALSKFLEEVARYLIEVWFAAIDRQREILIEPVVESSVEDVIGWRQTQPVLRLQQGEILEMRVAIADEHKNDEAAEETCKVDLGTNRMLLDNRRHVLIGGIVFSSKIAADRLIQNLGEVFQPQLAAIRLAVKTRYDESGLVQ